MISRKLAKRRAVFEYLTDHPCVDCDETDPVVLDFDHVRGKKRRDVGRMISQNFSIATTMSEIGKCVVRCANCHRRRTAKKQGWYKHKMNVKVRRGTRD